MACSSRAGRSQIVTPARYWLLFAAQSIGGIFVLWKGVPLYRALIAGEGALGSMSIIRVVAPIGLIQTSFWLSRRHRPPVLANGFGHFFGGHVVVFVGRLMFVFVGGVFSSIFYAQLTRLHTDPFKIFLLLSLLFSMFCYTLEIEKLGNALMNDTPKKM